MTRRTPPAGYPVARAPSQAEWDDMTQPGMSEYELTEMRRRRAEKISKGYATALNAQRLGEDNSKGIADLRLAHQEMSREVFKIREDQLGLVHTASQIHKQIQEMSDSRKDGVKESAAWKRQITQSLIAACAVGVSLAAILSNKC